MSSHWSTELSASGATLARFGALWLGLSLLPFLPALFSPLAVSPYVPLSVEVLVLVTAVVYADDTRWERVARGAAGFGLGALLLYQVYDAVVYTAFRRNGILYEDLQFLENAAYLVLDLRSWRMAGGGLLALVGAVALAWLVPRGLRSLGHAGRSGGCRGLLLAVHLLAWPLVILVGPASNLGTENLTYQVANERTQVRTVITKAAANANASFRLKAMLDSIETTPVDSSYASYDALDLRRPPPVYLLMVESYGSVLETHPAVRAPYRELMRRSESALAEAGWHMATARSEAPIQGGRSWLSIATTLTGTPVAHQLLFTQVRSQLEGVPHLVRFLDGQGYRTVALQPFTHERPGLPVKNIYDFDRTLYRSDLDYEGPAYGLAGAPDQYSLHYAHEHHLSPADGPFFLFFETVDSHALWNYGLPPYLDEWDQFNAFSGSDSSPPRSDSVGQPPSRFLPDSITAPVIFDQPTPLRYLRHVAYDLRVLREYLMEEAPEGSLVLLLGDHQPPLLDTEGKNVPLHVLSTDSTLVEEARQYGLTEGLVPSDQSGQLYHEGLYSLIVRLLASRDRDSASADTTRLPSFRPRGVSPSLLVQ